IDDAAGEAFDKVASILGLGFPGGPAVDPGPPPGTPRAFAFPPPFCTRGGWVLSFAGLKTPVFSPSYGQDRTGKSPPPPGKVRADLAASFQQAVVDVLVAKSRQALQITGLKRLAVGGGVSANACLRRALEEMAKAEAVELFIPPPSLCTDN